MLSPTQCVFKQPYSSGRQRAWISRCWEPESSLFPRAASSNCCLDSLFQTGVLFAIKTFLASPFSSCNAFAAAPRNLSLSCISFREIRVHCNDGIFLSSYWLSATKLVPEFFLSRALLGVLPASLSQLVATPASEENDCNRASCIIKEIFTELWPKMLNQGFGKEGKRHWLWIPVGTEGSWTMLLHSRKEKCCSALGAAK